MDRKQDTILLNILLGEIAAIFKNEKCTIADQFEGISILFADLVDFTPLTAELAPTEVVELLNEIFSQFDGLVEKYNLEKIRTIGDNYMVASGVPRARPDHAHALAHLALDMRAYLENRPDFNGRRIEFRFGISSGPVIGGGNRAKEVRLRSVGGRGQHLQPYGGTRTSREDPDHGHNLWSES